MSSSSLSTVIKVRARAWAAQLTILAKGFAPNHLKPYIQSRVEDSGDNTAIIRITVDKNANPAQKGGSADARAQEYGSGIHSKKYGQKNFITILPKNRTVLAFPWEVASQAPDRFKFLPDGRVMLASVQSPGIEAANGGEGYIAPAIKELKKRGKAELSADVRQAILSDIRKSFGHAG